MEGSPRPIGGHDKARRISGVTAPPGWLHRVCFEEGLEAHFLFDIATRGVVDANKSAEQLSGYSREELLELRLDDLHPRGSREKTISYFEKIKQHGSYMYDDLPLETKEQQRVPVEVKGALLGFGGGRIVQAMFRDVRKERQLQQEVLFQELKLTMLQSLSSAISDSLDLTEMLSDALAAVMESSGGLYGEMLLWLEDSGTFQIVSHQGDNVTLPETRLPLGSCPMAAQALNGQPVLLDSLDADPRLARLLSDCQGIAAVAAVPLRSKSRVVGVMHLVISERQLFPTFDFDFFTSIGNQIGMAAEHALLFQRSSAQTKQITVLNNIARIISSSLQIEEVFDSFAAEMAKLISFDRLSVTILDDSGSYLRIFASGSRVDSGWGMESIIPVVGTGPGWVVLNERPFIHEDTRERQQFIEDEIFYEDGIRSYIILPLESRGKLVGTFGLGSRQPGTYSKRDLTLLGQLSEQISVAIENVKLYQQTKENSILDDVSSLFNFRYFHQALDRELKLVARHRSRLSLIFIDLDNFKQINDTHGHLRGSRVLRAVGFLLRAAVRETDIAARYGGDEFVVILPDTDLALAKRLGEHIRKIICHHVFLRDEGLNERLGASIGVATYPSEAHTKEELIQLADERMYRDKKKNHGLGR
ncbi:MAG TPA: diguanylate cyclase [Vicinamibacteria bacterium]|nr:diguanylate cyclase [Vicinamibacteria bacterium]